MATKSLLAAFAAVGIATTGLCDITSANIVGYSSKSTGADNNFVTISFALVGYNTADIQQIKLSDPDSVTDGIGWGSETFVLWEGLPTVVDGSYFTYLDPSMGSEGQTDYFWGDMTTGVSAQFSVIGGQAVVVNCAEGLQVTFSGQVPEGAVEFESIKDNNFTGNPFPAAIDIQAIKISDPNTVTDGIGWGSETFVLWEGLPTVVDGSYFTYLDSSMGSEGQTDYFWGDMTTGVSAVYPIAPSQGVVINTPAAGLKIKIDPPYNFSK